MAGHGDTAAAGRHDRFHLASAQHRFEDVQEPARQDSALVSIAGVECRLTAAGLFTMEDNLDTETFERTLFEWAYPEIAERLQRLGQAYPALSEDGELLSNPLRSND